MSKENPKIYQEIKWKDAWKQEEKECEVRLKYRRRGRKILPDSYNLDLRRVDGRNRNWKRFRKNQWKPTNTVDEYE
jgi:hypothetical protein